MTTTAALPVEGIFPELGGATAWLNSEPLTPAGLHGRVGARTCRPDAAATAASPPRTRDSPWVEGAGAAPE